jgi:HSP20 family molecular chaperone IbpA
MPVVRWEPYQDAARLRFYGMLGAAVERSWMPAVAIIDSSEAFVFRAELAGMGPEGVHVELEEDVPTIKGERPQEERPVLADQLRCHPRGRSAWPGPPLPASRQRGGIET